MQHLFDVWKHKIPHTPPRVAVHPCRFKVVMEGGGGGGRGHRRGGRSMGQLSEDIPYCELRLMILTIRHQLHNVLQQLCGYVCPGNSQLACQACGCGPRYVKLLYASVNHLSPVTSYL